MTTAKLAAVVLTVLALLGSVSCQGAYPPAAATPQSSSPAYYPPAATPQPQPPSSSPPATTAPTKPPTYPPTSSSPPVSAPAPTPPPISTVPPTAPLTPPPAAVPTPTPPAYPPTTSPPPRASPPTPTPTPPPAYPPASAPPPRASPPSASSTPTPTPPAYPPTSPPPRPSPPAPAPAPPPVPAAPQLKVGYYNGKCGRYVNVEAIVRKYVNATDAGMQAGLVRLFFHDCFVRGCDASVLLDPTSANPQPEKLGIPNFPSLRGFEVIDAAKAELEAKCPGKVSCADIVAFAARDASLFLSNGGINFTMPAGRYDGNVSLATDTLPNLPPPFGGFAQLERMFAAKGLDASDMITLSGAHSIGRSHCSSFSTRLSPAAGNASSDMDPAFAAQMRASCASANGTDNTVAQDYKTPDVLDNQYFKNVVDRKVLFASDAALTFNFTTNNLVRAYADFVPYLWQRKFAAAMVKMGGVEIKTAATGEIRKTCRVVNTRP